VSAKKGTVNDITFLPESIGGHKQVWLVGRIMALILFAMIIVSATTLISGRPYAKASPEDCTIIKDSL